MMLIKKITVAGKHILRVFAVGLIAIASCSSEDEPELEPDPEPESDKLIVDPSVSYQEMIGFGGALSWYSDRIVNSSNKNQILDLIFKDLGADIIRFKTWYYPDNYPSVTSTASMSDDNSKMLWESTNQLHQFAKDRNPGVNILLSSWGPPAGLKSNNKTREGTLKKDGDEFMYDAYADYWDHLLDNLPFSPEYLSIQNEPTYVNAGWTTCQWAATETSTLPGYDIAFDKVNERLQARTNPPIMIGPESQDVATFSAFAEVLKNKPYAGLFAFHPYNINSNTSASQIESALKSIGSHNAKPNIMTEYSDNLTWFNTAIFIHKTLVHANSSGYIYWKLVWAQPTGANEDAAMVSVNSTGAFTVTPFYYVIKHYAKHIDAGYKRVEVTATNSNLEISAFINPDQNKITVVVINSTNGSSEMDLEVKGRTISNVSVDQSKEGDYFYPAEGTDSKNKISFPSKSISTIVINI